MKKILFSLLLLCVFAVPSVFAQGKTEILVLGRSKGKVSSMQSGGHTLVDAKAAAKKIGGTVELFAASKQLKVAFPGMYAILSVSLREVIINAATIPLPTEVVISGGTIYAPVEFFMLPQVQKALNRQITFQKNTLIVEKNYTLSFENLHQQTELDQLVFWSKGKTAYTTKQPNGHTVRVEFENALIKRNINQRPKDNLIRSYSLSQRGENALLEIILGSKGKAWKLAETAKGITVNVAETEQNLPAAIPTKTTITATLQPMAAQPLEPSITQDNDEEEAEELDLQISAVSPDLPVMNAAEPPVMTAATSPVLKSKSQVRIVVDPGHGGKDPGAARKGSAREKDLNLAVAKHLYNYLKKQGFEVKLTRENDTFVTLAGRSKMANEFKADLFISVHTNAAKRGQANGFEVYFRSEKPTDKDAEDIAAFENEALQYEETHYSFVDKLLQSLAKNEYMNESSKLASHVRNYVYKEPGIGIAVNQNNAVKQANFYVLRGVQAPAILVEMGYISSPKDRARLNNKSSQKHMGEGIGKGVVTYLKQEGKIK